MTKIHFRANSNVNNIAFWVLAYIVSDTTLHTAVQQEVDAAWTPSSNLNINSLCANSPTLDGIFHECLRTKGGAMMGRKVLKPVRIGSKWLRPGAQVLIPSRQLHSNEKVWGPDRHVFDAGRFSRDKALAKHSSYRPFGGGVSLCPGRKISRVKVFALVAVFLRRFDVQLCESESGSGSPSEQQQKEKRGKQEFPTIDLTTPALGVTGPAKGMDLLLDIKPRAGV